MMKTIFTAVRMLIIMTVLTGLVYPFVIEIIGKLAFERKSQGSLVYRDNQLIGSELIGQNFDNDKYFRSRPSATNYNPIPSGGSNLGPSSRKLNKLVTERRNFLMNTYHIKDSSDLPIDMIFASASGLDPHISPEAARIQIDEIAASRKFNSNQKKKLNILVEEMVEKPQFFHLGQPRINVFKLNLSLDTIR